MRWKIFLIVKIDEIFELQEYKENKEMNIKFYQPLHQRRNKDYLKSSNFTSQKLENYENTKKKIYSKKVL